MATETRKALHARRGGEKDRDNTPHSLFVAEQPPMSSTDELKIMMHQFLRQTRGSEETLDEGWGDEDEDHEDAPLTPYEAVELAEALTEDEIAQLDALNARLDATSSLPNQAEGQDEGTESQDPSGDTGDQ